MHQPPLSGGSSGLHRPDPTLSPTGSEDSDSDISLGTHSPVPSSLSLQHSPGSASGGAHEDRLGIGPDDKDYRSSFSALSSFRFDGHSPAAAMAGECLIAYLLLTVYLSKTTSIY